MRAMVRPGPGLSWARALVVCSTIWVSSCIEQHPDFVVADGGWGSTSFGTTSHDPSGAVTSEVTSTSGTDAFDTSGDGDDTWVTTSGDDTTGESTGRECTEEICDGLDNDCDGDIDEDCECLVGEMQSCYSGDPETLGVGVCEEGSMACEEGIWGACEGDVLPSPEVCNGEDDDCNGEVDEGFGQVTCGLGICQVTVDECVDGEPVDCVPGEPEPEELCNGQDDDCDGEVDEGCPCVHGEEQSCYSGPSGTEDVGLCAAGVQTCSEGAWGACQGDTTPQPEACNGQDDDCDGEVDGGNPGGGGNCNTGLLGVCAIGQLECHNGSLQCAQQNDPGAETCDGLDNDCDGFVDNGNPGGGQACDSGQLGVCAAGTTACQNGSITCLASNMSSPEICDGLDNDCDGAVDEGNPGGGVACDTGELGVCGPGTTACMSGSIVCVGNQGPSSEVCDGQDNDCNGIIDDDDPGGGQGCNTGLSGVCAAGTTSCNDGSITCTQNVASSPEVCDGLDNDCNGLVDDGNPGGGGACNTGLSGVCQPGTLTCQSGSLQCVQNQQPSPEVCGDGLDNDCNGLVDEGCPCVHGKCSTGASLNPLCDPCVAEICDEIPSCCTDTWDSSCVAAVQTVCQCANCAFGCAHNLCAEGAALASGCDPGGCVSAVCTQDPFCCNTSWDSVCVLEVGSTGSPPTYPPVCHLSCDC